jgi:predicted SAM-dependent methyltransferase
MSESGQTTKLMLNLGSGSKPISSYINIDSRAECDPDIVCDIRRLPYNEESVDRILASDILEHVGRLEIEAVLKEWYRVLKKGGLLIIKTPNVDTIIEAYQMQRIPFEEFIRKMYGGQEYPGNYHYVGFKPSHLASVLEIIGFKILKIENILGGDDWSNMGIRCQK